MTDAPEDPPEAPRFPACVETGLHSRDRDAWLAARRKGLGGSDVGAVLGLHPYRSALEVYADKLGAPVEVANDDGIPINEAALWGNVFEEPILREFGRRAQREVRHAGELLRAIDAPWLLCTLDGEQLTGAPRWAVGRGVAEIKTTGYGAQWAEEIPPYVQAQVQQQLLVTGASWATLVWLPFPERKLQWFEIPPHPEFQALIRERCAAFWTRVLEERPPDADGSDSARRALHALDPSIEDLTVQLDNPEAEAVADELEEINSALKSLEARKKLIGNRVLQTLAGVKVGLLPSGRYWSRWTTEPRDTTCPKCATVIGSVKGSTASRLFPPRKKPHDLPLEARTLRLDEDRELSALLRASLARVRRAG